jgi:hypothetical protein
MYPSPAPTDGNKAEPDNRENTKADQLKDQSEFEDSLPIFCPLVSFGRI